MRLLLVFQFLSLVTLVVTGFVKMAIAPILGLPYFVEAVPLGYLAFWSYRFVRSDTVVIRKRIEQSFKVIMWFQLFVGILSMFICLSAFSSLYSDSDLRDLVKKEAEREMKSSAMNEQELAKEMQDFEDGLNDLTQVDPKTISTWIAMAFIFGIALQGLINYYFLGVSERWTKRLVPPESD